MTKPNLLQKKNEMEVFSSKNMIKKISHWILIARVNNLNNIFR